MTDNFENDTEALTKQIRRKDTDLQKPHHICVGILKRKYDSLAIITFPLIYTWASF